MKAPRRPLLVKLLSQNVQYFFAGSKQLIKKKQQQKDRTTTHLLKGPVHPKSYKNNNNFGNLEIDSFGSSV